MDHLQLTFSPVFSCANPNHPFLDQRQLIKTINKMDFGCFLSFFLTRSPSSQTHLCTIIYLIHNQFSAKSNSYPKSLCNLQEFQLCYLPCFALLCCYKILIFFFCYNFVPCDLNIISVVFCPTFHISFIGSNCYYLQAICFQVIYINCQDIQAWDAASLITCSQLPSTFANRRCLAASRTISNGLPPPV